MKHKNEVFMINPSHYEVKYLASWPPLTIINFTQGKIAKKHNIFIIRMAEKFINFSSVNQQHRRTKESS